MDDLMDNEMRRAMRAAFRAGYRYGYADLSNGYPHEPNGPAERFLARVEAAGEVELGPDDLCLRCGKPLGERVPMYVFVTEPGGPIQRAKGVRMHIECGARYGNTVTVIELAEMMEALR